MRMTKLAFLLWSCAVVPAISSACEVEQGVDGGTCEAYFLPKSLASYQAALTREIDFHQYLKEIESSIREQKAPLSDDHEIKKICQKYVTKYTHAS